MAEGVFGGDRYGADVLAGEWRSRGRIVPRTLPVEPGLVVEVIAGLDAAGDGAGTDDGAWVGAVVAVEKGRIALEDRRGRVRWFPLGGGFLVEGEAVVLSPPAAQAAPAAGSLRTASGSRPAPAAPPSHAQRALTARASRILVEGRHDAELVEKVWGSDLRAEGVVVEYLEGADRLVEVLAERGPGPGARFGVLLDHLVPGSKESRLAERAAGPHVLVVGHPYVDVWQAVRPERLGLERWPEVPRGTVWKHGICAALGWPHETPADLAAAWQRILGSVRSYTDLEPSLLGRVEQLIDFVTAPE